MKELSAVILTKNEEKNIQRAIKSIKIITVINVITVIDDGSTDKTIEIAKKLGAVVISHPLANDYAAQRNFALQNAPTDWILFLDADEEITPELAKEIENLPEDSSYSAYNFKRIDTFWNTKMLHGEAGNCFVPRLVNKTKGNFVRPVHEEWNGTAPTKNLSGVLDHFPHPTIKEFVEEVNTYSDLNSDYFVKAGKRTNVLDILFTPLLKFIYTYFVKFGFLDGVAGFVYSFMMSFHSFLSRAKLYTRTLK